MRCPFDADGERGVSGVAEYGFEMVDAADTPNVLGKTIINQKFTPNQISRALRKFSAI